MLIGRDDDGDGDENESGDEVMMMVKMITKSCVRYDRSCDMSAATRQQSSNQTKDRHRLQPMKLQPEATTTRAKQTETHDGDKDEGDDGGAHERACTT